MDADEIARLVEELRVSPDIQDTAVSITVREIEKGQQRLERVVVGKIFSRKSINRETLKSNLPKILRARGSTEIEMVGNNLFTISFSLDADKRVALEDGPWHFFQDLMILQQSQAMQTPAEVKFDDITLWAQCHNVPLECMDPSIIKRIGEQVGKVVDMDVGEGGLCLGKFARVRVSRPITELLVRCVPLKPEGMDKETLVIIQYEKLPDFCFLCGRVGHISRDCKIENVDRQNPRFGSWLRAGRVFASRRSLEAKNQPHIGQSSLRDIEARRGETNWRNKEIDREKEVDNCEGSREVGGQKDFVVVGAVAAPAHPPMRMSQSAPRCYKITSLLF